MLTNHAFNAMLKTLEEPPAQVKFILATTDPQKIPVTVLSRCLQFNLKQMPQSAIVGHLENILDQEQIQFELPALRLLAQGAQGSMRDALSLTDQAIAYAAGTVSLDAVQGMLGALDQTYLIQILDALVAQDGAALLAVADQMATRSLSYKAALQDLATLLHQVSIAQLVPTAIPTDLPERAEILRLADLFDAEQIQLFYQIAVHGRNELHLAPDEYAGFSMTLLRMLAFRPVTSEVASKNVNATKAALNNPPSKIPSIVPAHSTPAPVAGAVSAMVTNAAKKSPALAALEALQDRRSTVDRRSSVRTAGSEAIIGEFVHTPPPPPPTSISTEKKTELAVQPKPQPVRAAVLATPTPIVTTAEWDGNWPKLAAALPLRAVAQQLAQQSELISYEVTSQLITINLRVPLETLLASGSAGKLTDVLSEHFSRSVKLNTEIGIVQNTAHAAALVDRAMQQDAAEQAIKNDLVVQGLMREFGATIVPGSVKPTQLSQFKPTQLNYSVKPIN